MAGFHFFTDIEALSNQPAADAFGPVSGAAATQFRVTSIHRAAASASPNAYAVCDGLLLAQDAGTDLLNLILKPTEQPPFAFPKIKFLVYRGVQKSSLVSGDEVAPTTNNDLTKSIWDSQQARNASAGTSDAAPVEALGIDVIGGGSIEDVFYRDNVSFQLPLVRSGWSLGKFDLTQFGFEIMVESVGFDPELAIVRTSENVVNVAALPASPTQAQEFEHWHDKEAILNYIDPCAFFGGFYFHTLRVKHSDGSVSKKKKNELYDDVLKGAHLTAQGDGVFFNRHRTYLDIRNEYNHSINYFKNYGTYSSTDVNCAFDASDPLAARNYYSSGWPLMSIDAGYLPVNNTSTRNVIRLALPDGAGENPYPTIYVSAGHLSETYPREPKDKARLLDLNVSSGFTDEVSLSIPNHDGLPSTTPVSSYVKLKYFKRIDPAAATPPISSGTVIRAANYLDNLFAPFALKIPFAGGAKIKSVIYDDETFISGHPALDGDLVVKVGRADDVSNVTLFACPFIVRDKNAESISAPFLLSGKTLNDDDTYLNRLALAFAPVRVRKSQVVVSAQPIDYVEFINDEAAAPSSVVPDFEQFIALALGKATFNTLSGLAASHFESKYLTYLGVVNVQSQTDDLGFKYTRYELTLRSFVVSGGTIGVSEIRTDPSSNFNTNLAVYSS